MSKKSRTRARARTRARKTVNDATMQKIYNILIVNILLIMNSFAISSAATYQRVVLAEHNQLRALHHAPKLRWDEKLARYAQQYAEQCRFIHSRSGYGENLAAGYPSVAAAVQAWYAEKKYYSYAQPGFSYRTGHFTQLIWKGSQRLGCGYAVCNGKNGTPGNYLVCEYSPPGNLARRDFFVANVEAE